ncbi:hypothetical protein L798_00168 [Zootermopsis nevadensis]|uniref:Uncharacterized protein n=1 Tax=Zootermopsis nevadensis TaxID=136037 RepID=A0A067RG48_ZOONE|nr:hypothetical protein L798_00168 [Zootermopsis nevadensis]
MIQCLPLRIATCCHGALDTNISAAVGVEQRRNASFDPIMTSTYSTSPRALAITLNFRTSEMGSSSNACTITPGVNVNFGFFSVSCFTEDCISEPPSP